MSHVIQNTVRFTNASHNMIIIELRIEETDLTEPYLNTDVFEVEVADEIKFMNFRMSVLSKQICLNLICPCFYKKFINHSTMLLDATGSFIFGHTASYNSHLFTNMLDGFERPLTSLEFPLTVKCALVIKKSTEKLLKPFQNIDEVSVPIQDSEKAPVQYQSFVKEAATNTTDYCNAPIDCLRELSVNLKNLLDQAVGTDIAIHVDGVSMKAHKMILRARSPVFEKMFDHDTSEAIKNEIDVKDIRASIMKELLTFLYAGTIENHDFDDACDLYYAADKYEVLSLRNACAKDLLRHLQVNNACQLLILATNHGDESLKEKILKYIMANVKEIVATKSFEELAKYDANLVVFLMRNAFLK
ncbi:speckle-type POZ protein B [Parasteatoda tepidariorum]|uniref:speckle-type POZ protein B n=1 Tax=Parasteatoda tepidariorum TaxID=114398 RepID=UPI00077F89F3|nr:speckle-type POZ protein B [Parasteatoda tepidariorum]